MERSQTCFFDFEQSHVLIFNLQKFLEFPPISSKFYQRCKNAQLAVILVHFQSDINKLDKTVIFLYTAKIVQPYMVL